MKRWLVIVWVVLAAPSVCTAAEIPILEGLRPAINFWKAIFATYSSDQVVFHDPEDLSRIYSALDFTELESSGAGAVEVESRRREAVREEIERLQALFIALHARGGNSDGLGKEERRMARLFASDATPTAFLSAAGEGRIRAQTGLRDRFATGLEIARGYLPQMERIFRAEGLPIELTRLPFVESCFNIEAYSKVGAAGLWQFMPSTGRLYMTVNSLIDERRDWLASTVAAAKHLKGDYASLGSWPLAVTAYNHGRGGMARAAAAIGTKDLVRIVREYRGPSFGFASRNFYAEFLAAIEVERMADKHFGPVQGRRDPQLDTAAVPVNATFSSLARAADVDRETLANLNPALSAALVGDRVAVPQGYQLRLPSGSKPTFEARAGEIVAVRGRASVGKATQAKAAPTTSKQKRFVRHRVRAGQTLGSIARQHQTTIDAIRRHNRLRDPNHVPAGHTLVIPRG